MNNIEKGSEVFVKDDLLRSKIKVVVRRTQEGEIKVDRTVVSVLEHRRGAKQISFLASDDIKSLPEAAEERDKKPPQ